MTLSPVFRSAEAVRQLHDRGYVQSLQPSIEAYRQYKQELFKLLPSVLNEKYLGPAADAEDDITFLQEHFFLILFHSLFKQLGCPPDRLDRYGLLNLCIKGMVVAGDNLFDDENKMDLPLALGKGTRFASIMQLLSFDHMMMRILEREPSSITADQAGNIAADQAGEFRKNLLTCMADIGQLEGSEEAGVREILPVEEMIERVHRVRGGLLFSLAFVAPSVWEPSDQQTRWRQAQKGIADLGTAFQIVDDVTDFEFDLQRNSHNLLSAWIVHQGSDQERSTFDELDRGKPQVPGLLERFFAASAGAVLQRAEQEARRGFETLADLGFWFPPADAGLFVRAIAGDAGDQRVQSLS